MKAFHLSRPGHRAGEVKRSLALIVAAVPLTLQLLHGDLKNAGAGVAWWRFIGFPFQMVRDGMESIGFPPRKALASMKSRNLSCVGHVCVAQIT